TPGNSGANQTWNLDSLQSHVVDTNYFKAPASTPFASSFPSANLASYNSLDSTYIFYDVTSNYLHVLGNVIKNPLSGNPTALSFTPAITQITFPCTMSSTFNVNNATAQAAVAYSGTYLGATYDSVRGTTTVNRTSLVDGWGSVTTPVGTFNCLRQKLTEI